MTNTWIRFSRNKDISIRMFCFPYAGGSAQVFQPLAKMVPRGVDVFALELPGRGRRFREHLLGNIHSIVNDAMKGIFPLLDKGFIFFGHSLGGLVAFELARALRRKRFSLPRHLFVSGVIAPQIPNNEPPVYNLPRDAFIKKLEEIGGTPTEIVDNEELLELMIPILRSDFQVYETYKYVPEPPLECPVTVFGGAKDKIVKPEHIEEWSEQTSILFSRHILNGGHFFIQDHLGDILNIITRTITLQRPW
ncbi:MAG: thioesterase [Deltaproteobacteria bacterium]|nr:thioesterase [Deltaproteobacteria bacterium]